MTFLVAGIVHLPGPAVAFLLVLSIAAAVVLIVRKKPNQPSRNCPKCGRGLIQPPDAQFCSYCGDRLP